MSRNDPIQRRVTSSSIKAAVASAAVVATLGGWAAIGLTDARQSAVAPAGQQAPQAQQQVAQQPAQSEQWLPQAGFEPRRPRFAEGGEHEGDEHEGYEHEGYEHEGDDDDGWSQAAPQAGGQTQQAPSAGQAAPQQQQGAITRTRSSR